MKKPVIIKASYIITNDTIALFPAFNTEYDTLVYERDKTYGVKETVLTIIENSCRRYCSDMKSRARYISGLIQVHKKVPLLIEETNAIFTFPTHSPTDPRCEWIAFHHIDTYKSHEHDPSKTTLTTYSNITLNVSISCNTFKKQYTRTGFGLAKFQMRFKFIPKKGDSPDDENDED